MKFNLRLTGKRIEIFESVDGVYPSLETLCEEIIYREKNLVIEHVYFVTDDFHCEMEDFFSKLKAGTPLKELFNKDSLLEATESQRKISNQAKLEAEIVKAEEQEKKQMQENIYAAKQQNSELTLKDILKEHIGKTIGINLANPSETIGAILVDTQADFFTVNYQQLNFNIPYTQIIRLIDSHQDKVITDGFGSRFAIVVKIFDFVVYKGAVGIGVPIEI